MDLTSALFTPHAQDRMAKRGITEQDVRQVITAPEQILPVRPGRVVAQRMIGEYLLRVFLDVDRTPVEVVTAYRTSQLAKYRNRP